MVSPATFNEFLKWYEDRQNSGSTTSVAHTTHTGRSLVGITHSNFLSPWVVDSGATNYIIGNKKKILLYLPLVIYLPLPWLMALGSHLMVLVLLISFLRCLLIMFSMSLGLPLTYYLLVVSLVPLIVLFLSPKILFVYMIGIRDG